MEKQNLSPKEAYNLAVKCIREVLESGDKRIIAYQQLAGHPTYPIYIFSHFKYKNYHFYNDGANFIVEKDNEIIAKCDNYGCLFDVAIALLPDDRIYGYS